MSLLRLLAALAALLALAAPARAADAGERILVMLRQPPEHYRAGSDYGGGYGDALARSAVRRTAGRVAARHGLKVISDWPMPVLRLNCIVMEAPAGLSAADAVERASRDPDVAWSQPLARFEAQAVDRLYPAQPAAEAWRLTALHAVATGKGRTVAVLDSQAEVRHPDLAGRIAAAQDFTGEAAVTAEAHGTAVAGIIAAGENGVGIVGVAPGARLLALRACWQLSAGTVCDSLSLAKALQFAIDRRADVINLSLSGPRDLLVTRLLEVAAGRGAAVVAAYDPKRGDGGFPASMAGVVAVASASAPPGVFRAPGQDVPAPGPGGRWAMVNGSSYSAAHVSGLAALMRERRPGQDVKAALTAARGADGGIDACLALSAGCGSRGLAAAGP